MRVAAVTGGSGTIGSATIRHLVDDGWSVRALTRSQASTFPPTVDQVRGDVRSLSALEQLVDGADTIFNIAGINSLCVEDKTEMWAVNVEAPIAVLHAASAAGVRRMIHVSSAAAVGLRTSAYAESKFEADQRLVRAAQGSNTELALIAPSSVQGPGRATGTGKMILDVINGRLKAMIDTTFSVVDIDDCATALCRAADLAAPTERLVVSGFTITVRQALELIASVVGRPLPVRFVPTAAVRFLAGFGPVLPPLGRLIGVDLCAEMIRTLIADHVHDGAPAAASLGIEYRTPLDTMTRLYEWAVADGLVGDP